MIAYLPKHWPPYHSDNIGTHALGRRNSGFPDIDMIDKEGRMLSSSSSQNLTLKYDWMYFTQSNWTTPVVRFLEIELAHLTTMMRYFVNYGWICIDKIELYPQAVKHYHKKKRRSVWAHRTNININHRIYSHQQRDAL